MHEQPSPLPRPAVPTAVPSSVPPQTPPPPVSKKRTWWLLALLAVAALLGAIILSVSLWYQLQLRPRTNSDIYHVLTIKSGASSQAIADDLEEKQIIKSSSAFLWYVKLSRKTNLQAGSYRLSSKLSTPEIATILADGKVSSVDVLIAPGLRLAQIKQALIQAGYTEAEIDQALANARSHPLLKGVPKTAPLEGYLFPETYKIGPDTTANQLVQWMLDTFEARITPDIKAGLKKQGLSIQEGIILASIVQKEVSDYPTQQKVAQVFLKRLNEDRVLGSDVTYMYAAAETGQTASPELNSPYNTRKNAGLPPSAIANFNLDALKAVANPANTTYNYFVAGDNGITYFSDTLEQHEEYTRQHCASCFQ